MGFSYVGPIGIRFQFGFTQQHWKTPTGKPEVMIIHELSHSLMGWNTYFKTQNGVVSGLMDIIDAEYTSPILCKQGSLQPIAGKYQLNIYDEDYWQTAPSEYAAEVFTALMVDPNHSGIPEEIRDYMINLILGAQ